MQTVEQEQEVVTIARWCDKHQTWEPLNQFLPIESDESGDDTLASAFELLDPFQPHAHQS